MNQRKLSTTTYPIPFLLVSSADHITAVTGLAATPVVTLSKNGAGFAGAAGAVSEIGSGWYALAGNATDRNTLGELLVHATGTGADAWDGRYEVVTNDPFAGIVLEATQPAITWAQQKIAANVAGEGALHVTNANAAGHGTYNQGGSGGNGMYNYGGIAGQVNEGDDGAGGGYGIVAYGAESGMEVIGDAGNALTISSTGANGDGVSIAGNGTGAGIDVDGGATGYGVSINAAGANGLQVEGGLAGATYGAEFVGSAVGIRAEGTSDYGIQAIGGTADLDPMPAVPGDDMDLTAGALAQVNVQVDTALSDIDLDHLIQITAGAEEPTIGTYLDQVMNKDAGQTFDQATDSLEALGDKLATAAITIVTGPLSGSTLTIQRGDTLTQPFSGLGNVTARTKLWFTIKGEKTEPDTSAAIQVLVSNPGVAADGLQRLNGAATTAAWGSLTVTDAVAGNVTLALTPAATAVLRETARYYDIQMLETVGAGGHVHTLTSGDCDINQDVTLAIV